MPFLDFLFLSLLVVDVVARKSMRLPMAGLVRVTLIATPFRRSFIPASVKSSIHCSGPRTLKS